MKLLGYEVTIKKLPKVTAESLFDDIDWHFRDHYSDEDVLVMTTSKRRFQQIKQLAKKQYDTATEGNDCWPKGDDISYFTFTVQKRHLFGRVTFTVTEAES